MTVSAIASQSALPTASTATGSTAAAPDSAATTTSSGSAGGIKGLFSSLTKRYRLLDTTGVVNAAAQVASANGIDLNALLNGSATGASQAAAGAATAGSGTDAAATSADPTIAAQQQTLASEKAFEAQEDAELAANEGADPADGSSSTDPTAASGAATDPTAAGSSTDEASQATAIAEQQEATTLAAEQTPTTPAAVATAATPATVAGSGTTTAAANGTGAVPAGTVTTTSTGGKRFDVWSAHIAQYKGAYLPDGPAMLPNCGPASVTMALRLVGLDVPGFSGQRSEAVLDAARKIGTGANDTSVGTTDAQLEKVITAAGGQYSETTDINQVLAWARQGTPTILAGDPAKGWDSRYSSSQVYPFDGGHWVSVSGYDAKTGFYIVNDPLSQIGPIEVSASELQGYMSADGGLGIGVFNTAAGASSGSTTATTAASS